MGQNGLHSRITLALLAFAIVTTVLYVVFVVTILDKLQQAMLANLVGHEVNEIVLSLAENPDEKLHSTSTLDVFLSSRADQKPVPHHLRKLDAGVRRNVEIGERILHLAMVDLGSDKLYLEFDISSYSAYRSLLLTLLIGGGIVAAVVLIVSGIWFSRKFVIPVADLAAEVIDIDPDMRNVRIRDKYRGYEVGAIADSIDVFLSKLDEFVEREQLFTEAVSHELRTPVAVISTATDLLELEEVSEHQKRAIGRIKSSAFYMGKVIESLLLFVRRSHESLDETLPEIDLRPIFESVVKQYKNEASAKGLRLVLEPDSPARLRMTPNHVEIILGNLINNAISNTDKGAIRIRLTDFGFSVKDSGRGIPAGEIDYIVELNYRDENSKGYGVGLYLVTNICDYYGLDLKIDSEPGSGSEFTVTYSEKHPNSNHPQTN